MDVLKRLASAGITPSCLCEDWDRIRALRARVGESDVQAVAELVEAQQATLLRNKPVLGAPRWFVVEVVPLTRDCFAVLMEDGHVENCAVVRKEGGKLTAILESP